ncbi:transposase [Trichonephila clavipes]|nr:transposase [Trichonephila clavipes]
MFHQDNARPHTSVVTRQNLWELGWEVQMHPPYSPDLATSDYNLYLALQNFLGDKKLGSREDSENRLLDVFAYKGQDFYERGFMKIPLKWSDDRNSSGLDLEDAMVEVELMLGSISPGERAEFPLAEKRSALPSWSHWKDELTMPFQRNINKGSNSLSMLEKEQQSKLSNKP